MRNYSGLGACTGVCALVGGFLLAATSVAVAEEEGVALAAPGGEAGARFPMSAGYADGVAFSIERPIAPGITHRFESLPDLPLTRNVVTVDMGREDLALRTVIARDNLMQRETVPSMVARTSTPDSRALVGINADFWGPLGHPLNYIVANEMIWRTPPGGREAGNRSFFAFDDERNFYFGQDDLEITLTGAEGETFAIGEVNFTLDDTKSVVYTWPFGDMAPEPPEDWHQAVLRLPEGKWVPNDKVTVTVAGIGIEGAVGLDREVLVLQSAEEFPDWVVPAAELELLAAFPQLPGRVVGITGGGGHIVKDGENYTDGGPERENLGPGFYSTAHPRTALGMMPDGKTLVMVLVDGRQPGRSRGISLPDLAEYMISLGVQEAINLDGGGSSTMVVTDEVVNFPSDVGGARSVTNALVVYREAPLGPAAELSIFPDDVLLPAGSSIQLSVFARDESGEQVPLNGYTVMLSVEGEGAAVDAYGSLTVEAPGEVTVTATASKADDDEAPSIRGTATFAVAEPEGLSFSPGALLLESGDTVEVTLHAGAQDGRAFFGSFTIPSLQVPDFVTYDPRRGVLIANERGAGFVTATLGTRTARLPVAVDRWRERLAYSFDELPAEDPREWMTFLRADVERSGIALDTENKQEGEASWRWDYTMAPGAMTKIALPLRQELPGEPLALGVWVKGDGKGQWLRGGLRDGNGTYYYLDFTSANPGIDWDGEWRFLRASFLDAAAVQAANDRLVPPLMLEELYLVQPDEGRKDNGTIWVDGLYALELPRELRR